MEIYRELVKLDPLRAFSFQEDMVFFDIETTGLSRKYSSVYLVGFMYLEDNHPVLEQVFISDLKDESKLLSYTINKLNRFSTIYTYNGISFDINYINKRAELNGLKEKIKTPVFDIYREILKYKDFLNLENYKLKTIEKLLNIDRKDKINGKESIRLYFSYLKEKKEEDKKFILLHNFEDIKNLHSLLAIFDIIDDNRRVSSDSFEIILDSISFTEHLEIKGNLVCTKKEILSNSLYKNLVLQSNKFYMNIPVKTLSLNNDKLCTFTILSKLGLDPISHRLDGFIPKDILPLYIEKPLLNEIKSLIKNLINLEMKKT